METELSSGVTKVILYGDTSKLTETQKIQYYTSRCEAAGLDPRTQPFAFIKVQGKEILYALKTATDQLSAIHGIRCEILSQTTEDGVRVVTVRATTRDGRMTEEIGAVPIEGLKGEARSNALMKCSSKAKRRAILCVCGLGMLDETEVSSIPGAVPAVDLPAIATKLEVEYPDPEPFLAKPNLTLASTTSPPPLPPVDVIVHDSNLLVENDSQPETEAKGAPVDLPITQPQRARFFALARAANMSDKELRQQLRERYGFFSTTQVTQGFYDQLLQELGLTHE